MNRFVACLLICAAFWPIGTQAATTEHYRMWSRPCAGNLVIGNKTLSIDTAQIGWLHGSCRNVPYTVMVKDNLRTFKLRLTKTCPYSTLIIQANSGLLWNITALGAKDPTEELFNCPAESGD